MKGFTLLEVLISSIIMSIIMGGTVSYLVINTRLSQTTVLEVYAQNVYNLTLKRLQNDIRNSISISIVKDNSKKDEKFKMILNNRNGEQIIWENVLENSRYKIYRNEKEFIIPGITTSIETKFLPSILCENEVLVENLEMVIVGLKITVWSDNLQYQISNGDDFLKYVLYCRNKYIM